MASKAQCDLHSLNRRREQAGSLVLISSDLAGVVNGVVLPVNGGFMGGLATSQVDISKMTGAARKRDA